MDYQEILMTLLYSIITIIVIPLITVLGKALVSFITNKIKDKEVRDSLIVITNIIFTACESIARQYVNSLKTEGKTFDELLTIAKKSVMQELTSEMKTFIENEYGEFETWLTEEIKAALEVLNIQ